MLLEFGCRMLHLVVFSTIGLALSPALSSSELKQQENQNKGTLDREENMLEQTLDDLAPLLGLSDVKIQNDTTHQQNRYHGFQRSVVLNSFSSFSWQNFNFLYLPTITMNSLIRFILIDE
jgi:hypothetical protein